MTIESNQRDTPDQKILDGARLILEGLGVDLNDHNFHNTPQRMLKCYKEMFSPPKTTWPVFEENYTDFVMLRGFQFATLCPHHMLPVDLVGSIAYYPRGKVIGASKLARIMLEANKHPMTQEALTDAIMEKVQILTEHTSQGAAVLLEGLHGCMKYRGIRSHARMVTTKFIGNFKKSTELQTRFMTLVRGN